jgi:hypothetical protein
MSLYLKQIKLIDDALFATLRFKQHNRHTKKINAYNKGFVVCKKEGCKHVKVGQCAILVFREKIIVL